MSSTTITLAEVTVGEFYCGNSLWIIVESSSVVITLWFLLLVLAHFDTSDIDHWSTRKSCLLISIYCILNRYTYIYIYYIHINIHQFPTGKKTCSKTIRLPLQNRKDTRCVWEAFGSEGPSRSPSVTPTPQPSSPQSAAGRSLNAGGPPGIEC